MDGERFILDAVGSYKHLDLSIVVPSHLYLSKRVLVGTSHRHAQHASPLPLPHFLGGRICSNQLAEQLVLDLGTDTFLLDACSQQWSFMKILDERMTKNHLI